MEASEHADNQEEQQPWLIGIPSYSGPTGVPVDIQNDYLEKK